MWKLVQAEEMVYVKDSLYELCVLHLMNYIFVSFQIGIEGGRRILAP